MEEQQSEAAGKFELHSFGKEGTVRCVYNGLLCFSNVFGNIIITKDLFIDTPVGYHV